MTQPQNLKRTIVAIGGGGPKIGGKNIGMERYLLSLAHTRSSHARPKVCFIGTASGDANLMVKWFTRNFEALGAESSHLSLFFPKQTDFREHLLSMDLIYVGGGNTKSMLALWKEWGIDRILRECWEKGVILSGSSAGSICWFEQGVTDSLPGCLSSINCLGLLPGSNCPHFDGEPTRRPGFLNLIEKGEVLEGFAADDAVGLHFEDRSLLRVVSAREGATAYRISKQEGRATETALESQTVSDYI